ncbi:MAG TPA: histidine kinase [Anaerolineales bacterium]|nr:histidine kinase [Anaerolineales bacterium]
MIVKYMALGRRLLHIPLFYKIVLANALIITAETLVGSLIVISRFHSIAATNDWLLIAVLGGAGLAVSIALTSITVALTLAPLNRLQKALTEMQQGHFGARVDVGAFGDEQLDQLANAFNHMLTTLEQRSQELQRLSQDILRAHKEERARVARELHDEAAQDLTGLLARIKVLEKSRSLEEVRQSARELRQLTAQTLEDVGRIALELRPAIVDYLGLDAALCARVEELSANHSVNASLRITGVDALCLRQQSRHSTGWRRKRWRTLRATPGRSTLTSVSGAKTAG